jgi:hypothetical protein
MIVPASCGRSPTRRPPRRREALVAQRPSATEAALCHDLLDLRCADTAEDFTIMSGMFHMRCAPCRRCTPTEPALLPRGVGKSHASAAERRRARHLWRSGHHGAAGACVQALLLCVLCRPGRTTTRRNTTLETLPQLSTAAPDRCCVLCMWHQRALFQMLTNPQRVKDARAPASLTRASLRRGGVGECSAKVLGSADSAIKLRIRRPLDGFTTTVLSNTFSWALLSPPHRSP